MASEWTVITATVSSCRINLLESYSEHSNYTVGFEYFVDGISYGGRYKTGTPVEPGHQFEVTYNPENPRQNTGSDPGQTLAARILIWIGGACLAALLIYLNEKYRLHLGPDDAPPNLLAPK
jgi:hypothetical protein